MRRRARRVVMAGFVIFVVIIAVLVLAVTRPGRFIDVGGAAYGESLGDAVSGGDGDCLRQHGRQWWLCDVETDPGSGYSTSLILREKNDGCWQAKHFRKLPASVARERVGPGRIAIAPRGRSLFGCVSFTELLSIKLFGKPGPAVAFKDPVTIVSRLSVP